MTNKEIAKWLQSLKSEIGKQSNQHLWNYEKAIDMAIEALKAQIDGDLVSKADVMETYADLYWFDEDSKVVSKEEVDEVYKRLLSLLSEEPKTGKWVEIENGEYLCSNCSRITIGYPPHYCPYCRSYNE